MFSSFSQIVRSNSNAHFLRFDSVVNEFSMGREFCLQQISCWTCIPNDVDYFAMDHRYFRPVSIFTKKREKTAAT